MIIRGKLELGKPTPLTEQEEKEIDALKQMDDDDIDYSDIPPLTKEELKEFRPLKDFLELRKHA